ncbi:MAG: ribosomal protein L7/L12, partial [Tepidisphaerales bacterium]
EATGGGPLSAADRQRVVAALNAGKKIEAIRVYREATGLGLKEAKDAVEAMPGGRQAGGGCLGAMLLFVGIVAAAWFLLPRGVHAAEVSGDASRLPAEEVNLKLAAPIKTWDEAIPLGNGLLGGLLWGEGNTIRLSLDRGDLWDERPAKGMPWEKFNYANLIRLVSEKKPGEVNAIFDYNYNQPHPTKIPAGRLEITLDPSQQVTSFELALATAVGRAALSDGVRLDAFFSANKPVAIVRIPGPEPKVLKLLPPASVKKLGYADPAQGGDGAEQWFVQEAAQGLKYCVCVASRREGNSTLLAVTVTSTKDGEADVIKVARERVAAALAEGYDAMLKAHAAWWAEFWGKSRVSVPDIAAMRHYYLVQYFYGAASRWGAPPMPLQGVWTADAGSLPPWKGDYHNDLNTQMTYIAYQAAGRFDEGASFLDFMWNLLPTFRKFARDFYGTGGAAVPGVMTLDGQALGGWPQYSLAPTQGAWIGHLFYLHWRYTGDDRFLRERAYPWCSEIGKCLTELLKPDADGVLKLPLSASPEIFDNSQRAWVKPSSNYDIACMRMLFLSLAEMAETVGDKAAGKQWPATAKSLGEFHVNARDELKVCETEDLPGSHRHLSNIMGIHPFNLTTIDGGDRDRRIINASLAQWDQFGTKAWCGYSFSWMSCLRARVGDGEAAGRYLDTYLRAFILRNGFHANGDQTRSGLSNFTYRPFTLEGNFLAAQAVQEMLLQSWSPTPGQRDTEIIRIFPAMPARWKDAGFDDLRAEGGYRVSARRENGVTTWFRITATHDGVARIRDTFAGRQIKWAREGVRKNGENFEVSLKAGEAIEGTLPAAR